MSNQNPSPQVGGNLDTVRVQVFRRTVSPHLLSVMVWLREFAILNGVVTPEALDCGTSKV